MAITAVAIMTSIMVNAALAADWNEPAGERDLEWHERTMKIGELGRAVDST